MGDSVGASAVGGKAFRRYLGEQKPSGVKILVSITSAREHGVMQAGGLFDSGWKDLMGEADTDRHDDGGMKKFLEFMDPEKNAIVRSFESVAGRGLAGFITSLSLDYDNANWEMAPGQRAPQTVMISLDFSPIHDLPLGLDYRGRMYSAAIPAGLAHTSPYSAMSEEIADDEAQSPSGLDHAVAQAHAMDTYEDLEGAKEDTADRNAPMPPSVGMPGMGSPALIGAAIGAGVALGGTIIKESV